MVKGQSKNRVKLIDDLINNLFTLKPVEDSDDASQWKLNENVSLTLTFIFPQIFLKAIEILDSKGITIYQYTKDKEHVLGQFNFKHSESEYLVLVSSAVDYVEEKVHVVVDIDQWFCSCHGFEERFEKAVIDEEMSDEEEDNVPMYGFRRDLIFQFLDDEHAQIPICEHLLAYYFLQQHHQKLNELYRYEVVDMEQWLTLHSTLINPE